MKGETVEYKREFRTLGRTDIVKGPASVLARSRVPGWCADRTAGQVPGPDAPIPSYLAR